MSIQRDQILRCACDLYLAEGMDGFSMRKLAKSVGVTAPALYKHYESKERLLQDVMVQGYQRFAQYLYRGLVGADPAERMILSSRGYLDFALENPRLYELIYAHPATLGMTDLPEEVEALGCAIGQFWNDRVRECMDAGLLTKGDPQEVSMTLWAHAHGLVTLYLRGMLMREAEGLDDERFREVFGASSIRLLSGPGTAAFVSILQAHAAAAEV